MLYDEEFVSRLPAYRLNHNNPRVVTICRSEEGNVVSFRAHIERWYAEHCVRFQEASSDLRGRLRSQRNDQFTGAYSELLVFDALCLQGGVIDRNFPLDNGTNIDFRFTREGADPTLVEVRTFLDLESMLKHETWFEVFRTAVESEFPDVGYWVHFEAPLTKPPDLRKLRAELRECLRTANWVSNKCSLSLELLLGVPSTLLMDRQSVAKGWYGGSSPGADLRLYVKKARNDLEKKFDKYRDALPSSHGFVAALCTTDSWLTAELLATALFGKEVFRVNTGRPEATWSDRESNGLYSQMSSSGTRPRFDCVSGVLFCRDHWPLDGSLVHDWFWFENPVARVKSSLDLNSLPSVQRVGWKSFLPFPLWPYSART
jgi:hypothetical protein